MQYKQRMAGSRVAEKQNDRSSQEMAGAMINEGGGGQDEADNQSVSLVKERDTNNNGTWQLFHPKAHP